MFNCLFQFCLQILVKYTAVKDLQTLICVSDFIESVYKSMVGTRNQFICIRYGNISARLVSTGLLTYGFILLICQILPIILFAMGNQTADIRVQYPGIDQSNLLGWAILVVFGNVCCAFYFAVVAAIDLFTVNVIFNMKMVSSIIIQHLDDLEIDMRLTQQPVVIASVDAKRSLIRIVQMIQKYNEYVHLEVIVGHFHQLYLFVYLNHFLIQNH